jgi:mono/diheme cytochrome c family protein
VRARWSCLIMVCFGLTLGAGCNDQYPKDLEYKFSPHPGRDPGRNVKEIFDLDPDGTPEDKQRTRQRADLAVEMKRLFGTPLAPTVNASDSAKIEKLGLDAETLAAGSALYRKFCLHCHGLVGDGNGSTAGPIDAPFLTPRPRDFRQGMFKFRSTAVKQRDGSLSTTEIARPSRADLAKTIRSGVPTASMPSFNLLDEAKVEQLVSYVIHLGIRGRVEKEYARNFDVEAEEVLAKELDAWQKPALYVPEKLPKPWDELQNDRERGRKIYLSETAACASCHGKDGRASAIETPTNLGRRNEWGDLNPPRDLTIGGYRGGSRPIDIFYRIRLGVAGSGMPAADPASVKDEEVWYLVDYVLSLPQQK